MTNEAIRLMLLLVQAGVTALALGVLITKGKAMNDSNSIGVIGLLSLMLLIALWTVPSRLIQDAAPNTVPVVQEELSNSPADVNPVAEPTPDPFEQNRMENEEAKERFLNLE